MVISRAREAVTAPLPRLGSETAACCSLTLTGPILAGPILTGPILTGPILTGPILHGLALAFVRLLLAIDLGSETAQHIEDEADHDEVDADVEERRGDEGDLPEPPEIELEPGGGEGVDAEEERNEGRERGEQQPASQQGSGVHGRRCRQLQSTCCQIAGDEGESDHQPARETPTRRVVTGQQEEERDDDQHVEDEAHDHLEEDRAVAGRQGATREQPGAAIRVIVVAGRVG